MLFDAVCEKIGNRSRLKNDLSCPLHVLCLIVVKLRVMNYGNFLSMINFSLKFNVKTYVLVFKKKTFDLTVSNVITYEIDNVTI